MQRTSRIRNEPMRSPSPDLAHKNSIKNTKAPLEEIRCHYTRMKTISPISRSSNIPHSNISYSDLLAKYNALKIQYQILVQQNYGLQNEFKNKQNNVLKDYQDKITELLGQINRIQNLYREERYKYELALKEASNIKDSYHRPSTPIRTFSSIGDSQHEASKTNLANIEGSLRRAINQTAYEKSRSIEQLFYKMNEKIRKLEQDQIYIENRSAVKRNKMSINTDSPKHNFTKIPKQYSTEAKPYQSNSPEDEIDVEQYKQQIDFLNKKLQLEQQQNSILKKQIKKTKQRKSSILQESEKSMQLIENNGKVNKQLEYLKIAIDQEKKRSYDLEKKYLELEANSFEQKDCQQCMIYLQKIKMLEKDRSSIPEKQDIMNLKKQLLQKDFILKKILENHLSSVGDIRSSLCNEKVNEFFQENSQQMNEMDSLDQKLNFMKQQNGKLISQLKQSLLAKDQQIISLRKQNQTLTFELENSLSQKQKLQKIIEECIESRKNQQRFVEHKKKSPEQFIDCKNCIEEAVEKINILESQINETLTQ